MRSPSSRPVLAFAIVLAALACSAPRGVEGQAASALRPAIELRYDGVEWVDAATLAGWMTGDESVVLLDTRAREEFEVSHLRGARWVDPDVADVATLGLPRDARVVVYCSVGWRSGRVTELLRDAGHRHAFNLEGGIFTWANQGRPVYRGDRRVEVVHPYDAVWGRMLDAPLHAERP